MVLAITETSQVVVRGIQPEAVALQPDRGEEEAHDEATAEGGEAIMHGEIGEDSVLRIDEDDRIIDTVLHEQRQIMQAQIDAELAAVSDQQSQDDQPAGPLTHPAGIDTAGTEGDSEELLDGLETESTTSTQSYTDLHPGDRRMSEDPYPVDIELPQWSPTGWNDIEENWNYDEYYDDQPLYSDVDNPDTFLPSELEDSAVLRADVGPALDIEPYGESISPADEFVY